MGWGTKMDFYGVKQIHKHYFGTYAPVLGWSTIRFSMSLAMLNEWHTRQPDFILVYTQADASFVILGKAIRDKKGRNMN